MTNEVPHGEPSGNPRDDSFIGDTIFGSLQCRDELTRKFIRIAMEDIVTFDEKQQDYGPSNISDFGELGVLIRVSDKLARLRNLCLSMGRELRVEPTNESIEDSWRDLSVYGVIARMLRRGEWPGGKEI